MKKSLLGSLFVTLAMLVFTGNVFAAAFEPVISEGTSEHWYHMVFQRYYADLSLEDKGAGEMVTVETLELNKEAQLWKLEDLGNGYYKMTSKLGNSIYFEGDRYRAGAEVTGIKWVVSTNTDGYGTDAWSIVREGGDPGMGMNPHGGSVVGNTIGEYYNYDGGNAVKFVNPKAALANAIADATLLLDNTKEGNNPGTFSTADRTVLQDAIAVAESAYDDDSVDHGLAANTLTAAIAHYKTTVVMPKISSGSEEYWYLLKGERPANTYLTHTTDGTLWNTPVGPNDRQLWKFLESGDGFVMVNKETGEYIDTDPEHGVWGAQLSPTSNAPDLKLVFKVSSKSSDKLSHFFIENAPGHNNFRLHSGGGGAIYNYYNDINDNVTWLIMELAQSLKVILKNSIDQSNGMLATTAGVEGDDFGQFSTTARTTFANAVQLAQNVYNDADATPAEVTDARVAVDQAYADYLAAQNMNLNSLLSSNPDNYRWYKMVNLQYEGEIISSVGRAAGEELKVEDEEEAGENGWWRFEVDAENQTVKFINKTTGLSIEDKGTSVAALLIDPEEGTNLKFYPTGGAVTAGRVDAGDYQYFHSAGHRTLVGWEINSGATKWQMKFAGETAKPVTTYTVSVSANDDELGSAVISGTTETSVEASGFTGVSAAPMPGSVFVNWTDAETEEVVSSLANYFFIPTTDVDLVANFEKLGKVGDPYVSTPERPVYYYIQSASDGSQVFNGFGGDFRSHVMISPENPGFVQHNVIDQAPTTNHMLWQIVDVDGDLMLKNRATGLFMRESHSVGNTGTGFVTMEIDPDFNQYAIRGADQPSFGITWQNNLMSRLSDNFVAVNGLTAWYFVVEPNSMRNYNTTTGIVQTDSEKLSIYLNNGVITVDGADSFELYTIGGQKINSGSSLMSGVYIVKVGDRVEKVLVK